MSTYADVPYAAAVLGVCLFVYVSFCIEKEHQILYNEDPRVSEFLTWVLISDPEVQ